MKIENDLGNDRISGLVWKIAIPSMLAQFVSVCYSIVAVSYTHLDVYKRQVLTWKSTGVSGRPHSGCWG